jgi:hypothetical protein
VINELSFIPIESKDVKRFADIHCIGSKLNEAIRALNTMEAANASANTASTQCKCVVKVTEVKGMCIMYPRAECAAHGHLQSVHC